MVSGIIPFSLAEVVMIGLVIVIGWKAIITILRLPQKKECENKTAIAKLINILAFIGMVYIIFIFLWGLNYYRLTFADIAHLTVKPASAVELANVCEGLIDQTNRLRTQVEENPAGIMKISEGKTNIFSQADVGYKRAAVIYPELGGKYGKPKGVLLSEPMSYLGISGIYCPFTGEPNVNMAIPDVLFPVTVCHEMAHQRGFAREDEANYIAYIACKLNPDPEFQYSGYLLAVINSMKMLKKYDTEKYLQLQQKYSQGVKNDLINNAYYWDKHSGIIENLVNHMNDLYLKSNRQGAGVASYNRMVDLLVAEYRLNHSLP